MKLARKLINLFGVAAILLAACSTPAAAPTAAPTSVPPTTAPTAVPPTAAPTSVPPTTAPTSVPPTTAPTLAPPTVAPTLPPTVAPTVAPTDTPKPTPLPPPGTLILATTTSTADTGLLAAILPYFEARENVKIKVIAVGTGQALAIAAKGDADVVLVHARAQEDKFVADGFGINRRDVMYNDFVLVGPAADPAGLNGVQTAKEAFAKIAAVGAPFASRGDGSGTNSKEKTIWTAAGLTPQSGANGYAALGQGMAETLQYADQVGAYTITDRGTWLAQQAKLPNLVLWVGGDSIKNNPDKTLYNPYGVIVVNPAKFPKVNSVKAELFASWITSVAIQRRITEFGRDQYGQSLFYALAHP